MRTDLTQKWSRRTAAAALAVAAITGLSACSSGVPEGSSRAPASNPASQEAEKHMAASDFSNAMDKPGTIVLDVRTPAEFASGHLPKAQNIDLKGADFATRIAALDKNATYAVYCQSGKRSNAAMEQMAAADFKRVYDLEGGIVAWQSMGGAMKMGSH